MLTGEARDDLIKSNARVQNKFPSVWQFLQKKMKLDYNGVAVFASWIVMNEIVADSSNAFLINAGPEEYQSDDAEIRALSAAQFQTPTLVSAERHDYYTFRFAMAHLKKHRPRALHISFIETDMWAHNKRYDMVLHSLRRTDGFFKELWQFLETDKHYKGKTSVIVATDHGRGLTENDWGSHGKEIAEARYIWMAFISPDSSLRGEWRDKQTVYQNQIAATMSKFLGFDYAEQNPNAGKPIAEVLPK
jgi:predicted AlkP superfamily pyrophosphatase or phosphodiesterase